MDTSGNPPVIREGHYSKFYNWLQLFRVNQLDDYDNVIALTGLKGCGKSSLALKIGIEFHRAYCEKPFDMKRQVVYTPEQLEKAIDEANEYDVIDWDEAALGGMAEDWNKSVSKVLKKKFITCRTKHLIILLCLPDISWLDPKYRGNLLSHWIHIPTRGVGIMFTPDPRPGTKDAFHIDFFEKEFGKRTNTTDPAVNPKPMVSRLTRHPCCEESFGIPGVEKELYLRYLDLRNKAIFGEENGSLNIRSDEREHLLIWLFKKYLENIYTNKLPVPKPTVREIESILTIPGAQKPLYDNPRISLLLKSQEAKFGKKDGQ